MGRISLDNKLVLICDFNSFHAMDSSYDMEILDHLTITKNQNAEINQLLTSLPESRTMVPQNNVVKSRLYQSTYQENLYFLLYYAAMFIFCIIFLFYILKLLIRNNRKEYTIHLIYGACRLVHNIPVRPSLPSAFYLQCTRSVLCTDTNNCCYSPARSGRYLLF